MTLILRPPGRGNWGTVVLKLDGRRAPLPIEVTVGQVWVLAGQQFRVAEVRR